MANPRYRAVVFDLDDTLLRTSVVKWAHHKAVAKQFYGIDLTDAVLAQHWGMPFEPMIALFYQNADTPEAMLRANLSLDDRFPKEVQHDGLDAVAALLGAGIEVGVVTSILGRLAEKDLRRLGFPVDDFFIVQGADDAPAHKPDPRVFDAALELLTGKGILPSETVYVGDALMDHHAARDAGMAFLGVTTGFVTAEDFEADGAAAVPSLTDVVKSVGV